MHAYKASRKRVPFRVVIGSFQKCAGVEDAT